MNLLLTGAFSCSGDQAAAIESLGYLLSFLPDERGELPVSPSAIDAVVCNGLFLHHPLEKFTNLRFIQLTSSGLDRVPPDQIRRQGIELHSARGVYSVPMAEWAILKILELCKKSSVFFRNQEIRVWEKQRNITELPGKKAIIIGFGDVGAEIAKRLKPFGVQVLGAGRQKKESPWLDGHYAVSEVDNILPQCDIIISTLPLTEGTRHFFNKSRFSKMPAGSIFINLSRGGVVDETALAEVLREGRFSGVALDVFEKEPLDKDSSLWGFENALITPHNSFLSDRVGERLFSLVFENLKNFACSQA